MGTSPPDPELLGRVLAALHNAPLCTTLRAQATIETDSAEQVALVRRRAQSSRQGRLIVMEASPTADDVVTTSISAFMDGVGRFRVEADGHVTIGDRTGTTTGTVR